MASERFGLNELRMIGEWLSKSQSLPNTNESFSNRYGGLPDTVAQTSFVAAISAAQKLATAFGSPSRPGSDRGQSDAPPDPTFEHFIWLAGRIAVASDAIATTFQLSRNQPILSDGKAVLAGPGGLTQRAANSRAEIAAMRARLDTQRAVVGPILETLSQSPIYDLAGQEIGRINAAASAAEAEVRAIDRKLGGWLADKDKLQVKRAKVVAGLTALLSGSKKWEIFRNDTKPLLGASGAVTSAFISLDAQLEQFWMMFDGLANRANHVVASASLDQLANGTWVYEALGGDDAEHQWRDLAASARNFVTSTEANGLSR